MGQARRYKASEHDPHYKRKGSWVMAKDYKYRNICLLLYPEWENYNSIIENMQKLGGKCFWVEHKADEEESKPHTHVLLSFTNPRRLQTIANKLNIDTRFCVKCSNKNSFIRYLVHADNPEKVQYSRSDILVSSPDCSVDIDGAFSRGATLSAGSGFVQIFDFIRSSTVPLTIDDIVEFCIKTDSLGDMRTYWSILLATVKEQNVNIYRELKKQKWELERDDFYFNSLEEI